ncbi:MAG: hypothetical protein IJX57_00080, partial [Clostridia bacterium]|nr:hypothetical protein [Clostridia bacterium]
MLRTKKLIALLCAISMIFTVFTGFSVVNAEETKGIALEYVADESTATEKTIVAKYVGCDNGVTAYNVTISIPEGATVVGTDKTGLMANDNLTATTYSIGGMGTAQVKSEGNVLAVIKINLSEANDAP